MPTLFTILLLMASLCPCPVPSRTPMHAQASELLASKDSKPSGSILNISCKPVHATPRTAEEPTAKAIASAAAAAAAAAAVKKAEEGARAVREAEENTLAAVEVAKAARLLADRHRQQMGGERGDAKNLHRTSLSKGFGVGLASTLRSEGAPF